MYSLVFGLLAEHVRVCLAELLLVEILTELLASLGNFLLYFLFDFAEIILDKVVCTISFLGILIVDKRIIERSDMA